jgi:hypothetical protein
MMGKKEEEDETEAVVWSGRVREIMEDVEGDAEAGLTDDEVGRRR